MGKTEATKVQTTSGELVAGWAYEGPDKGWEGRRCERFWTACGRQQNVELGDFQAMAFEPKFKSELVK